MRSKPDTVEQSEQRIHRDAIVFARPHFRQDGNRLYFFHSNRIYHNLSETEVAIWEKLRSGPVSSKLLKDSEALQSMLEAGLIEAIVPLAGNKRRKILVIEPHCDDAALSIGATMWSMKNEAEFHLLTLASRSNYTSAFHLRRNYFDRARITNMRTREGELFTEHLGGHYHCAGLDEATLRYNDSDWDLDFFNAHEVATAISNNRRASPTVLSAWIEQLKKFMNGRSFDEIWVPLGAGSHSDHDLARNASLSVILEEPPAAVVRLYEDVPYGAKFQEHTNRILQALTKSGANLSPWWQTIKLEFPAKLKLLGIFASQFKVASIRDGIERSAEAAGGVEQTERLWTLKALPGHLPADEIWIGAADIAKAAAQLPKFLSGASNEKRLAIFAVSAAGGWNNDLRILGAAFPRAKFVVYAGPLVRAEFAATEEHRVELHNLSGRVGSWLRAALRESFTGHRIVISGNAIARANALSSFWRVGRKIICSDMDHLIQALADRIRAVHSPVS